jgi:hypothetical protein
MNISFKKQKDGVKKLEFLYALHPVKCHNDYVRVSILSGFGGAWYSQQKIL